MEMIHLYTYALPSLGHLPVFRARAGYRCYHLGGGEKAGFAGWNSALTLTHTQSLPVRLSGGTDTQVELPVGGLGLGATGYRAGWAAIGEGS